MATGKRGGPGIKDRNVSESAGLRPYKLDCAYASISAFLEDKAAKGSNSASAEEGDFFWHSGWNAWCTYSGGQWVGNGSKEVDVTASALSACATSPVSLVAAPGTGYVTTLEEAVFVLDFSGTAYTTGAALTIRWTDGSGAAASDTVAAADFMQATGDAIRVVQPLSADAAPVANAALVLDGSADSTVGSSPLRVKVAYRVHPTGL